MGAAGREEGPPPGQACLAPTISFKSSGHSCVCPCFRLAKVVAALGFSLEQKRGHAVLRARC